ncbi:MAG TPA: VTT domain-containing protein, partial [Polyangiaceae bacterium]|nr:VTT domain-containing protein [Polyangiaceae bacterium]
MAKLRVALILTAILMVVVAWRVGVFRAAEDSHKLAERLVALGVWGYVAFVVAYAVLQPFGLPGTVFVFAAPLIWPWPVAFALSMTGTMAATSVGFLFSRFVARDWIAPRIPVRFKKYDEALERRAFATVFTLRFIFWMPPPLHAFFGVS